MSSAKQKRVCCIIVFDGVDVVDFTGPYEVFQSAQRYLPKNQQLEIVLASVQDEPTDYTAIPRSVLCIGGLRVIPDTHFALVKPDILVIPGGRGSRIIMNHKPLQQWLTKIAPSTEIIQTVCTGSFILSSSSLIASEKLTRVCIHHLSVDELREILDKLNHNNIKIVTTPDHKFIENGKFVMAAGVTSGFDASLHVVNRVYGSEIRDAVNETIEYKDYNRKTQPQSKL